MSRLRILSCLDSEELASRRRQELDIPRDVAAALGRSAVEAVDCGFYRTEVGQEVVWQDFVRASCAAKRSIAPDVTLPDKPRSSFRETCVQVSNETTLGAARRLVDRGLRPLALNLANGIHPGGGFLGGARAQEEVLCRSSALYATLVGDPTYEAHRQRPEPDSTDWAILSPDGPVFKTDSGTPLERPWLLSFMTCAAPYAPAMGQPKAGDLLRRRILRVLLQDDGLKALRERAEKSDAAAQADLGVMYALGKSVPRNSAEAMKWFRRAAEQNNGFLGLPALLAQLSV